MLRDVFPNRPRTASLNSVDDVLLVNCKDGNLGSQVDVPPNSNVEWFHILELEMYATDG